MNVEKFFVVYGHWRIFIYPVQSILIRINIIIIMNKWFLLIVIVGLFHPYNKNVWKDHICKFLFLFFWRQKKNSYIFFFSFFFQCYFKRWLSIRRVYLVVVVVLVLCLIEDSLNIIFVWFSMDIVRVVDIQVK